MCNCSTGLHDARRCTCVLHHAQPLYVSSEFNRAGCAHLRLLNSTECKRRTCTNHQASRGNAVHMQKPNVYCMACSMPCKHCLHLMSVGSAETQYPFASQLPRECAKDTYRFKAKTCACSANHARRTGQIHARLLCWVRRSSLQHWIRPLLHTKLARRASPACGTHSSASAHAADALQHTAMP
jgi:hypothetical protein